VSVLGLDGALQNAELMVEREDLGLKRRTDAEGSEQSSQESRQQAPERMQGKTATPSWSMRSKIARATGGLERVGCGVEQKFSVSGTAGVQLRI